MPGKHACMSGTVHTNFGHSSDEELVAIYVVSILVQHIFDQAVDYIKQIWTRAELAIHGWHHSLCSSSFFFLLSPRNKKFNYNI